MSFLKLLVVMAALFLPSAVNADRVPVPANKKHSLGSLENQLIARQKQREELEAQAQALADELENTRNNMVKIGQDIRNNEKNLIETEARIEQLQQNQTALEADLEGERESIASLVSALERVRRVPPEAMIAKPDAPLKTAQSIFLMGEIIPTVNKKANDLREKLDRLSNINDELDIKRRNALRASSALKVQYAHLGKLIKKREQLYEDTQKNIKTAESDIQKIARQARNLQDLLKKLEQQNRENARRAARIPQAAARGDAQLPISGIIRIRYNQKDNIGAPSQGISIEGRDGALIVAPMTGIVRFTGDFKNYGQIVILEHPGNYHSLIAGLKKIDTVVDQKVHVGEPIGLLHDAFAGQDKPRLYFELRKNGKPVDPAIKFADLG